MEYDRFLEKSSLLKMVVHDRSKGDEAILAAWRDLLSLFENEPPGEDQRGWAALYREEAEGQPRGAALVLLEKTLPMLIEGLRRRKLLDLLGPVFFAMDRVRPLFEGADEEFFQWRWERSEVDQRALEVLPPSLEDIERALHDALLQGRAGGEALRLGQATLFFLTFALAKHPRWKEHPRLHWIAAFSLLRSRGPEGAQMVWDDRYADLLHGAPFQPSDGESKRAKVYLDALTWSCARLVRSPDDDALGWHWVNPALDALIRSGIHKQPMMAQGLAALAGSITGGNTLRSRLLAYSAAWYGAESRRGKALMFQAAKRIGDETGNNQWANFLEGLAEDDAPHRSVVLAARRAMMAIEEELGAGEEGAIGPDAVKEVLRRSKTEALERVQQSIIDVGKSADREGLKGTKKKISQGAARKEQKRLAAVLKTIEMKRWQQLDDKCSLVSEKWVSLIQRNATALTRKNVEQAVEAARPDVDHYLGCCALDLYHIPRPALILAAQGLPGLRLDVDDDERAVAAAIDELLRSSRQRALAAPRALENEKIPGFLLDVLYTTDILSPRARFFLRHYCGDESSTNIPPDRMLEALCLGRASGWSLAYRVDHLLHAGKAEEAFDFMLQLSRAEREGVGEAARRFFEDQVQRWSRVADGLVEIRATLQAYRPVLTEGEEELLSEPISLNGTNGDLLLPRSFAFLQEASAHQELLEAALGAARKRAAEAISLAGTLIERYGLVGGALERHEAILAEAEELGSAETLPHAVLESHLGAVKAHLKHVQQHVNSNLDPTRALVQKYLPLTGEELPDGRYDAGLNYEQINSLPEWLEELPENVPPMALDGLRHSAAQVHRASGKDTRDTRRQRATLAIFSLAWTEARYRIEHDPVRRADLAEDLLGGMFLLGRDLVRLPETPIWHLGCRYLNLTRSAQSYKGAQLSPMIILSALVSDLLEVETGKRPERLPDPAGALQPDDSDMRLFRDVFKELDGLPQPFGILQRLARLLHRLSDSLPDTESLGSEDQNRLEVLRRQLPSVRICANVRPDSQNYPTIPYSRVVWRLIFTYASIFGRDNASTLLGFGGILVHPTWDELLRTTKTRWAMDDALKFVRQAVDPEGSASQTSHARMRLIDAHSDLSRREIISGKRKEAQNCAEILLQHLAMSLHDFLSLGIQSEQRVVPRVGITWGRCFYDPETQQAYFHLDVRNPSTEMLVIKPRLASDWQYLDRKRTLDTPSDKSLMLAGRMAPLERVSLRVFVDPVWAKDQAALHQPQIPTKLELEYESGGRFHIQPVEELLDLHVCGQRDPDSDDEVFVGYLGEPVEDAHFHGRRRLMADLVAAVKRGRNLELVGVRGVGKTSILHRLRDELHARDTTRWLVIIVQQYDTGRAGRVTDWYRDLARQLLMKRLPAGSEHRYFRDLILSIGTRTLDDAVAYLEGNKGRPTDVLRYLELLLREAGEAGLKVLAVFDQLDLLTKLWHDYPDRREDVLHMLSTVRAWGNDVELRRVVQCVLSGPLSFFKAVDRSEGLKTQPHVRGAKRISVPHLTVEEVSEWVRSESKRGGFELDPSFPEELWRLASGHPWIVAMYGHLVADVARQWPYKALSNADLTTAEMEVYQRPDLYGKLQSRLLGDSLDPDPHTKLCKLLLVLAAQHISAKYQPPTLKELEDAFERRNPLALQVVQSYLGDALVRLEEMGFLVLGRDGEGKTTYDLSSRYLVRMFHQHPELGGGTTGRFVEATLEEFASQGLERRPARIRGSIADVGPITHRWRRSCETAIQSVVGRGPGWASRLLAVGLNCGPVRAVTHELGMDCSFDLDDGIVGDEAQRTLFLVQDLLDDRFRSQEWERFCAHGGRGQADSSILAGLSVVMAREEPDSDHLRRVSHTYLSSRQDGEEPGRKAEEVQRHFATILQSQDLSGRILLRWSKPDDWLLPYPDFNMLMQQTELGRQLVRSLKRFHLSDQKRQTQLAFEFRTLSSGESRQVHRNSVDGSKHPRPLSIYCLYSVCTVQWPGPSFGETIKRTGRTSVEQLVQEDIHWLTRTAAQAMLPWGRLLFRTRRRDGSPYSADLTQSCAERLNADPFGKVGFTTAEPDPFPEPWRRDESVDWEALGHEPDRYASGLSLVVPLLRQ